MIKSLMYRLADKICNWALGAKGGEDATRVGVYYIQDWE
jgi:hypothetical protein